MALQKTVILQSGLIVTDAYLRISGVFGNKDKLTVFVDVFVNADATAQNKPALEQRNYVFTPSVDEASERWDKQGYEYVKSLDEYADAIDV